MRARLAWLAVLSLAACGDYSAPDSVVFGSVVSTQHAQTVDWNAYRTYSVNPKVSVVDGTGSVVTNCEVDGTQLVPTIKAQMDARGYTSVDWNPTIPPPPGSGDLQIQMAAMLGTQDVYYAGWCDWYYYYYCYPGWTYAGSYSFGTLVISMGDVLHAEGTKLPLVWENANYGVLASYYAGCHASGTNTNVNWARIQDAVNRAFDQSPYIKRTAP